MSSRHHPHSLQRPCRGWAVPPWQYLHFVKVDLLARGPRVTVIHWTNWDTSPPPVIDESLHGCFATNRAEPELQAKRAGQGKTAALPRHSCHGNTVQQEANLTPAREAGADNSKQAHDNRYGPTPIVFIASSKKCQSRESSFHNIQKRHDTRTVSLCHEMRQLPPKLHTCSHQPLRQNADDSV